MMDFDLDTVELAILVVVVVAVVYYLVRWWSVAGTWRDSDRETRGCLNFLDLGCGWGCLVRVAALTAAVKLVVGM